MPLLSRGRHQRAVVARLQVAVLVLFLDHRLGGERRPAVAVDDGCVWITNWLAAAGLTTMLFDVAVVRPPLVNWSEIVSAVLSARFVNVATPPETVAVASPGAGRSPLASAAVTTVLLSPVSRLPYWSSSSITGWVANGRPAVAVADGCVWIDQLAGRRRADTTMLVDVR